MDCSLSTTLTPATFSKTKFGGGDALIDTEPPPPKRLPVAWPPSINVVAVPFNTPPHVPSICTLDRTEVASMPNRPAKATASRFRLLTVALAVVVLLPGRLEAAFTVSRPVCSRPLFGAAEADTFTDATLFVTLNGGGAAPAAVGRGPLVTATFGPTRGVTVTATDSPYAELEADCAIWPRTTTPITATRLRTRTKNRP